MRLTSRQDPHPDPLPTGEGEHRALASSQLERLLPQRSLARRERGRVRVLQHLRFLSVLLAFAAAHITAARAEPPTHPFASTHVAFPRGTLRPTKSVDELEQATAAFY